MPGGYGLVDFKGGPFPKNRNKGRHWATQNGSNSGSGRTNLLTRALRTWQHLRKTDSFWEGLISWEWVWLYWSQCQAKGWGTQVNLHLLQPLENTIVRDSLLTNRGIHFLSNWKNSARCLADPFKALERYPTTPTSRIQKQCGSGPKPLANNNLVTLPKSPGSGFSGDPPKRVLLLVVL